MSEKIHVISMLTNHDKTIPNAQEVFEANKDTTVKCWGFKDVGIDQEKSARLVAAMQAAEKTTFLEPLVDDPEECLKAAQFAVDCGFDYLISMVYEERSAQLLKANGIKYFPTCGRREGLPRMLYGTYEEIIEDAKRILDKGVDGICLSIYRYVDGDPEKLVSEFLRQIDMPFIIAGGINNTERLDVVKKLSPWGFTIGSALFDSSFGDGNRIAEKLNDIKQYVEN